MFGNFEPTRLLSLLQGVFFLATGVWPLLHMKSFLKVTGPKTDLWLVRTVGLLIGVVGAALLLASARHSIPAEIILLAVGASASLAAIDIIYVKKRRISKIYLLDAMAEIGLIACWIVALATT